MLLLSSLWSSQVFATDVLIYSQEVFEEEANSLIIDFDDSGGDVTLQFGNTLNEQFFWDNANSRFTFTDDLKVQGNIALDGTTIFLDDDNVGAGADINVIASQGSDNDGILRYSATENEWQISNDESDLVMVGSGIRVVSSDATASVVSGSGFLNAKTVTIPGGALGTSNTLRVTALSRRISGSGSARFRLNYGGSIVADMMGANSNNPAHIQFYILAKGTNSQRGYTDHSNSGNTGTGTNLTFIDSTVSQDLILQIDPSGGDQWTTDYFLVELIK